MIDADIEKIKMHRDGRTVVFNSRVVGSGKAKLKKSTNDIPIHEMLDYLKYLDLIIVDN